MKNVKTRENPVITVISAFLTLAKIFGSEGGKFDGRRRPCKQPVAGKYPGIKPVKRFFFLKKLIFFRLFQMFGSLFSNVFKCYTL